MMTLSKPSNAARYRAAMLALVAGVALVACEKTATEKTADRIEDTSAQQADAMRNQAENTADAMENKADTVGGTPTADAAAANLEADADKTEQQRQPAEQRPAQPTPGRGTEAVDDVGHGGAPFLQSR